LVRSMLDWAHGTEDLIALSCVSEWQRVWCVLLFVIICKMFFFFSLPSSWACEICLRWSGDAQEAWWGNEGHIILVQSQTKRGATGLHIPLVQIHHIHIDRQSQPICHSGSIYIWELPISNTSPQAQAPAIPPTRSRCVFPHFPFLHNPASVFLVCLRLRFGPRVGFQIRNWCRIMIHWRNYIYCSVSMAGWVFSPMTLYNSGMTVWSMWVGFRFRQRSEIMELMLEADKLLAKICPLTHFDVVTGPH
jgi:hypothetical protein